MNLPAAHYKHMLDAVEAVREMASALVSGLVNDGFSESQAREITTTILSRKFDEEGEK